MLIIGECIHVISTKVRRAMDARDKAFIQDMALRQVGKGAHMLDLNIGPQKRTGPEVMTWMVETIQEVTDVGLSLDTTNSAAIETGLKLSKKQAMINSTDASEERLSALLPLAAEYNANIIALTLGAVGLPTTADARIELALGHIIPAAEEHGVSMENVYFDPLVLTVNGNQDQAMETLNAVRFLKQMSDPPPKTASGVSNISNGCASEVRSILNRVFLVMLMGAGLDCAIIDPLDEEMMAAIRIVENRDDSTAKGRLYLDIYDTCAADEDFDASSVDISDPAVRDIAKTVGVLQNKVIYADSYLRL